MASSLTYKCGDTWNPIFYIEADEPLSVAGCSARAQIRTKQNALVVDTSSEGADPALVLSEEDGKIRVDMTILPTITRDVTPGRYKLDLEMTYADGTVKSYPETEDINVLVLRDVSYAQ